MEGEKVNKGHLILLNIAGNHVCVRVEQQKKRYIPVPTPVNPQLNYFQTW